VARLNIHISVRQIVVRARTWQSGISTTTFVSLWLGQGHGKAEYPQQHSSACGWGKDIAKRNIHNNIRQIVVGARTWQSGISTTAFVSLWLGQGHGKAEYPQHSSACGWGKDMAKRDIHNSIRVVVFGAMT
jgi:hypothetical protein